MALVGAALAGACLLGPGVSPPPEDPIGEVHASMLDRIARGEALEADRAAVCFAPGTSDPVIHAFAVAMARMNPDRFQSIGRWGGGTAMGSSGSENQPITLTYSFAPDGTQIPSGVGEPSAASNIFLWLNGIYGSAQTWQDLFHQCFDRWEAITGVNFVYESHDDGASFFGNPGQLGVRGDIRIGAKFIDGSPAGGSVLGYAQFPNSGEIVLDSSDTYFSVTTNDSRRLRNVASHELGHAMGLLHVCPVLADKLMEPIASTAYDGPRQDDIRGIQNYYGDIFEPNEGAVAAKNLGVVSAGTTLEPGMISNPGVPSASALSLNEKDASPYANDEDWFRFSTAGGVDLTITLTPVGSTYQDNPQDCASSPQDCCSGATIDSLRLADLSMQLTDSSGSLLYATGASNGLGQSEQILWSTTQSETLNLHVYTGTNGFLEPQMYAMTIAAAPPPTPGAFSLVAPANGATGVDPGALLDWSDSAGATTYLVEVDDDVSFSSPAVSQMVNAPASQLDLPDATLVHDTQYFWRVTASNTFGNTVSSPSLAGFRTAAVQQCQCVGDLDGDCDTDVFDFGVFATHFGAFVVPGTDGDLDGNGKVDIADFGIFATDFFCGI